MDLFHQGFSFSGFERDLFMLNRGNGTFIDVSGVSGIDFIGDGRGAAFADFDNDGDLDVFERAMHGKGHLLFRNQVGQDSGSLRIALQGTKSGRDAYGATVRVRTSAGTLTKVKSGGSGFLSQSDPRLLFGLGPDAGVEWIEVSWPSGAKQKLPGAKAGESLLIVEGESSARRVSEKRFALPAAETPEAAAWRTITVARGAPFPQLNLLTLDGKSAPWRPVTRRTIVNFWATWCGPCAREMPELQKASRGKVAVIGISVDDETTRAGVAGYLRDKGVTYPVFVAPAAEHSRVYSSREINVPLSLVLDERGRVMEVLGGWSRATQERLKELAAGR